MIKTIASLIRTATTKAEDRMEEKKPIKTELQEKIIKLISGEVSRENVSEWAFSIIDDDHVRIDDQAVWKILQCLGAADLLATDRDFLYQKEDFEDWLAELRSP